MPHSVRQRQDRLQHRLRARSIEAQLALVWEATCADGGHAATGRHGPAGQAIGVAAAAGQWPLEGGRPRVAGSVGRAAAGPTGAPQGALRVRQAPVGARFCANRVAAATQPKSPSSAEVKAAAWNTHARANMQACAPLATTVTRLYALIRDAGPLAGRAGLLRRRHRRVRAAVQGAQGPAQGRRRRHPAQAGGTSAAYTCIEHAAVKTQQMGLQ